MLGSSDGCTKVVAAGAGSPPGSQVTPGTTWRKGSSAELDLTPSTFSRNLARSQCLVVVLLKLKLSVLELPSVTASPRSVEFDQPRFSETGSFPCSWHQVGDCLVNPDVSNNFYFFSFPSLFWFVVDTDVIMFGSSYTTFGRISFMGLMA